MESDEEPKPDRPIRRTGERMRADFTHEIISIDEDTRIIKFLMVPDPRRYEKVEREGGTFYRDRYFNFLIRLEDFVKQAEGTPIYAPGRTIDSAPNYAEQRREAIERELETGIYSAPEQAALAHAELEVGEAERDIAFLSIDICGSTAYRARDRAGYEKAYRILLKELGTTVGQFQGTILKTTGDGFIAFVDLESVNTMVDTTIDLGGTLTVVTYKAINPALEKAGLEPLSIRVGADFGPALVQEISIPTIGFARPEVTSDALHRAVKIEQSCAPGGFRIGYDLYRLAHVGWLERCEPVEFDGTSVGIPDYKVFEVR